MELYKTRFMILSLIAAAVLSLSGSCAYPKKFSVQPQIITEKKCQDLAQCFDQINFDLQEV